MGRWNERNRTKTDWIRMKYVRNRRKNIVFAIYFPLSSSLLLKITMTQLPFTFSFSSNFSFYHFHSNSSVYDLMRILAEFTRNLHAINNNFLIQ